LSFVEGIVPTKGSRVVHAILVEAALTVFLLAALMLFEGEVLED